MSNKRYNKTYSEESEEGELPDVLWSSPEEPDETVKDFPFKSSDEDKRLETQVEKVKESKEEILCNVDSRKRVNRDILSSPEEQPERKTRKSNAFDEELNSDTHWYVLRALQEDDDTPLLDSEVNLVNWEHPIGKKVSLSLSSIGDKKHYLKVFKRWRQSKKTGQPVRNDLRVAHRKNPEHLDESWEAFLKKCAAGNITEDIRKRAEGKEGKSLYACRQKVHRECTKKSSDIPCYIRYREGECRLCQKGKKSLEASKHKLDEYPNEECWDDQQSDAIFRY